MQSGALELDHFITLFGRPPRQRWLAGLMIDDLVAARKDRDTAATNESATGSTIGCCDRDSATGSTIGCCDRESATGSAIGCCDRESAPGSTIGCCDRIQQVRQQYEKVRLPRHSGKAVFDETKAVFGEFSSMVWQVTFGQI